MLGDTYKSSGKVKWERFIPAMLLGSLVSAFIGMGYGYLANVNPFIYMNFLILFVAVILILFLINILVGVSSSRNRFANFMGGLIMGFMGITGAWYILIPSVSWSDLFNFSLIFDFASTYAENNSFSVSKFGRGGIELNGLLLILIYIIEFLAFLAPAVIVLTKVDIYCEECDNITESTESYAAYSKEVKDQMVRVKDGGYNVALNEMEIIPALSFPQGTAVFKIEDHTCPNCKLFRVLNIAEGVVKKDDKGEQEFKKKETLIRNRLSEPAII